MTLKVYSVKSNARRDAKKQGLDPASVEACDGGFVIGALRPVLPAAPAVSPIIRGKRAKLLAMLREDWQDLPALMQQFGWQAHTVRGAMSTLARGGAVKIDRRRTDGVTQYRASQREQDAPTAVAE